MRNKKPIISMIHDDVIGALEGLKLSTGDVLHVESDTKNLENLYFTKAIVTHETPIPQLDGEFAPPCGMESFLAQFNVQLTITQDQTATQSFEDLIHQVEADIINRLKVDYTRGGFVRDQYFKQSNLLKLANAGGFAGIEIMFDAWYLTLFGDSYSQ